MDSIFKRKKKGNVILDSVLVLVFLVSFGLIILLGYFLLNNINSELQESPDNEFGAIPKQVMDSTTTKYPSLFDGLFVFAFILMWAMVIVASFLIDSHPIFFIFSIIILIFIIIAAAVMSNYFEEIIEDPEFQSVGDNFPMTVFLIDKLPFIILAVGFSIAISLFAKSSTR